MRRMLPELPRLRGSGGSSRRDENRLPCVNDQRYVSRGKVPASHSPPCTASLPPSTHHTPILTFCWLPNRREGPQTTGVASCGPHAGLMRLMRLGLAHGKNLKNPPLAGCPHRAPGAGGPPVRPPIPRARPSSRPPAHTHSQPHSHVSAMCGGGVRPHATPGFGVLAESLCFFILFIFIYLL